MTESSLSYESYLHLDKLLDSQHCQSQQRGQPAHDEMFFIIVHQTYELWFKNILFELERICTLLSKDKLDQQGITDVIWLLNRVTSIQQLLNQQLQVIDTMSPKDFLAFRDLLSPASGFQSVQFRLLEIRLGISRYDEAEQAKVLRCLSEDNRALIKQQCQQSNLFTAINDWLKHFALTEMDCAAFIHDLQLNLTEQTDNPDIDGLFDPQSYTTLFQSSHQHLHFESCIAVLFIMHYCDHPRIGQAYQLLRKVLQVDDLLAKWRFGHALMAQRMIGAKPGTGGSAGYVYLKRTIDAQRVFVDVAHLATYLLPADHLPPAENYLKQH